MEPINLGYSSQIDGSGEMVTFPDPYKNVTDDHVADATRTEEQIKRIKLAIEGGYYLMATLLDDFESRHLYLARGYDTFKAWCASPEIDIQYRLAHDMIRISREAVPLLQDKTEDVPETLNTYGISKVRALLPLLSEKEGQESFVEAFDDVRELTVRDTEEFVKEKRGIAKPIDEATPAIFRATVRRGENYHRVTITRIGNDSYVCGTISIKPEDWNRWEERFGGFVEILLD